MTHLIWLYAGFLLGDGATRISFFSLLFFRLVIPGYINSPRRVRTPMAAF